MNYKSLIQISKCFLKGSGTALTLLIHTTCLLVSYVVVKTSKTAMTIRQQCLGRKRLWGGWREIGSCRRERKGEVKRRVRRGEGPVQVLKLNFVEGGKNASTVNVKSVYLS